MPTVRIDGINHDPSTPAFRQALARLQKRHDDGAKALAELKPKVTEATARADAAEARVRDLERQLTPAAAEQRVRNRLALLEAARTILPGRVKLDGLSDHAVRLTALQHARVTLDHGRKRDEAYVHARFDAAVEHARKGRQDAHPGHGGRHIRIDHLTFN